jgi:hypothetical protein
MTIAAFLCVKLPIAAMTKKRRDAGKLAKRTKPKMLISSTLI